MLKIEDRSNIRVSRFCAAVVIAATWCASAVLAQENAPKPVVTVAPVFFEIVAESETFTGRIEAIEQVDLLARVPGFILTIGFKEGQNVSKGDMLFEIEPDAYQAAITQIKGQIKSAQAAKKLADIELTRQQTLFEKKDVAENVVQRAQAQQDQISGQLEQLQGSLQIAQLDLSYTKLTAPFDGRVGLTDISSGAYVTPQTGVLVSLSSINPIYVTFPVADSRILDFRTQLAKDGGGHPLSVELTLANDAVYPKQGKIEIVDTQVQSGTDTVILRAQFANESGTLLDGQLVRVKVVDQTQDKSLTIPVQALQRDQAGYFVLVVGTDGKVEKRSVDLAQISGLVAVVADGLKEGEQVITEGGQRAQPGKIVDPQQAAKLAPSGE